MAYDAQVWITNNQGITMPESIGKLYLVLNGDLPRILVSIKLSRVLRGVRAVNQEAVPSERQINELI